MSNELYKRYRPTEFKHVVGNEEALRVLSGFARRKSVPHTLLFSGPSGCGKTTLARILRVKLKCGDADFREMNVADFRGIDAVREIRGQVGLSPISGKCRVWLIDEAHKLTSDAQNAFLKLLEDTPEHVYFFLATTHPQKLLPTIRNRATQVPVYPLKDDQMVELLSSVARAEDIKIDEEALEKIVNVVEGSPRAALVLLDKVMALPMDEQLNVIQAGDISRDAIEIARALLKGTTWKAMATILKGIENLNEEAETIRWMVLGYMSSVALGGKHAAQAVGIIDEFAGSFFDTKKAGLIAACYNVIAAEQ